jgi:hypothetical protein
MIESDAVPAVNAEADNARRLLELVNGGWTTQAVYAAVALGIPDRLGMQAAFVEDLAPACGAHAPSLGRLMRALATLDLCRMREDGRYELTSTGALLRSDTANSLRGWTLYWGESLWEIWGHLLDSVRTGESARHLGTARDAFARLDTDPASAATFNRAMAELTRLDAANIVRACRFGAADHIVDVGGGRGELLAAMLGANPEARGTLFDRRPAIEDARVRMDEAGLAHRCDFVTGDFFSSVPQGADSYVLKSVIHDWDDAKAGLILRNCRAAMGARATLLLVERIVPPRIDASPSHRAIARADLNMLVGPGGRERTESDYRDLLTAAGLRIERVVAAGPAFSIIEATRLV